MASPVERLNFPNHSPKNLEHTTSVTRYTRVHFATADQSPFLASIILVHRLSGIVLQVIGANHLHTGWGLATQHFASLTIIGEIEPLYRESGTRKHCHQNGGDLDTFSSAFSLTAELMARRGMNAFR